MSFCKVGAELRGWVPGASCGGGRAGAPASLPSRSLQHRCELSPDGGRSTGNAVDSPVPGWSASASPHRCCGAGRVQMRDMHSVKAERDSQWLRQEGCELVTVTVRCVPGVGQRRRGWSCHAVRAGGG